MVTRLRPAEGTRCQPCFRTTVRSLLSRVRSRPKCCRHAYRKAVLRFSGRRASSALKPEKNVDGSPQDTLDQFL